MTIITLPTPASSYLRRAVVCFFDLQEEYVSPGRPLALPQTDPWQANCRALLGFARHSKLQIAHFRQLGRSALFNPATEWSRWIDEFKPRPTSEMAFERDSPSAFACDGFAKYIQSIREPWLVIAGLTGAYSCLTTAIESHVRGYQAIFVRDSSSSPALGESSSDQVHDFVCELIGLYAEVTTTGKIISWLGGTVECQNEMRTGHHNPTHRPFTPSPSS